MNGTEKVVEHLLIIQAVIDRLGRTSFWVKTWSLLLIVVGLTLIAIHYVHRPYFTLILIPFVLGFWILDGYFLWQERLFRRVYDEVRLQSDTDFQMDPLKHKDKPKCSWTSAIFSVTLVIFYLIEIAFTAFLFFIVKT